MRKFLRCAGEQLQRKTNGLRESDSLIYTGLTLRYGEEGKGL